MSEKQPIQPEFKTNNHESQPDSVEIKHSKTERKAEATPSSQEQQERLTAIRSEVNKEAHNTEELKRADAGSERTHATHHPVKKQLQALMLDRTLTRIRKQLPAPQRALSKLVHTKPVEVLSAAGEKTIARPYGLFGGGLAALVGSVLTFYMARNYGFQYNIFLFFTFFIAGYVLATLIELAVRLVKHKN